MNNHTNADTSIIEDAPGAHWSVYVDLLRGETRALRKTGAQGAAGGSGSEASFHDLTSTRSLHRDLGSCCWNKGSGERRRAIMQLCVLEFPLLYGSSPPSSPRSHSLQLLGSCARSASLDPPRSHMPGSGPQSCRLPYGWWWINRFICYGERSLDDEPPRLGHRAALSTTSLTPAPPRLRSE